MSDHDKAEREAFEKWAATEMAQWLSPYADDLQEYMGEIMQCSWMAWQAARQHLGESRCEMCDAVFGLLGETREIWIDGKRWGVLKETGDK